MKHSTMHHNQSLSPVSRFRFRWSERLFVALFSSVLAFAPDLVQAGGGESVTAAQKLRAEYIRLRNIDPTSDDPAHIATWRDLSSQMEQLVAAGRTDDERLRVDYSDVLVRRWRTTRDATLIQRATAALQPVLTRSESPYLGQAALLRAEIGVAADEPSASIERWIRFASATETADPRRIASLTLGLESGLYDDFVPSSDLEVPRIRSSSTINRGRPRAHVTLDPGHGGDDAGAVGVGGLLEKEVTYDIARRVQNLLRSEGIAVSLTRERDEFVPLARRTAIANKRKADVFVSLHNNASPSRDVHGLETYYLDNTDDQASRKLAERENSIVSGGAVDDLSFILSDLIQSGKLEDSIRLARMVDQSLTTAVVQSRPGTRSLGVKRAPFFVLVGAHMPCTLLEMFFIDHAVDGANLQSSAFREALARSVARGILSFLNGAQVATAPAKARGAVGMGRPTAAKLATKKGKQR